MFAALENEGGPLNFSSPIEIILENSGPSDFLSNGKKDAYLCIFFLFPFFFISNNKDSIPCLDASVLLILLFYFMGKLIVCEGKV